MKNFKNRQFLTSFDSVQEKFPVKIELNRETDNGNRYLLRFPTTLQNLPAIQTPTRSIGLWEAECYEFFLASDSREDYYEFNFSCHYQWNCFYLTHYRSDIAESDHFSITMHYQYDQHRKIWLEIEIIQKTETNFNLMQMTAVREEKGKLKYFALKHSEGKADFHDKKVFSAID